jgi:hypothetical protein
MPTMLFSDFIAQNNERTSKMPRVDLNTPIGTRVEVLNPKCKSDPYLGRLGTIVRVFGNSVTVEVDLSPFEKPFGMVVKNWEGDNGCPEMISGVKSFPMDDVRIA